MNKLKLYFSCALTGLSEEHRQEMVDIRERFKLHFDVMEFLTADTPVADIYQHDIHVCVAQCDLMIAVCDERSTGLGYELGCAIEKHGKPVLAVFRKGNEQAVSRLIQGIYYRSFELSSYESIDELVPLLLDFAKNNFPWKF